MAIILHTIFKITKDYKSKLQINPKQIDACNISCTNLLFLIMIIILSSCAQRNLVEPSFMINSKFFYNETDYIGYGTHGSGPRDVIFLHGFAASADTWTPLLPYIEGKQTTFHFLDLKGHGRSNYSRNTDFSLYAYADIVQHYIEEKQIRRPTIVGHSFGGTIALLYTIKNTQPHLSTYPSELFLMAAPAYKFPLPILVRFFSSSLLYNLGNLFLPLNTQVAIALKEAYSDESKIRDEITNTYVYHLRQRSVQIALRRTAEQIDFDAYARYMAMLPSIEAKVTIIWGEEDAIVQPRYGRQLHKDLPNSNIILIPACGHNMHEECPEEIASALKSAGF